jgi:hypothetical protein
MTDEILQMIDPHDNETLGPLADVLAQKAAEHWVAENAAEWAPYANDPYNTELMFGWCTANVVPVTLRNLSVAFRALLKSGQLKRSADYEGEVVVHISRAFAAAHPELEPYFYKKNFDIVEGYRTRHNIPFSVEGVYEAFMACIRSKAIIPGDRGFITRRVQTPEEKAIAKFERRKVEVEYPVDAIRGKDRSLTQSEIKSRKNIPIAPALEQDYRDSLKGGVAQKANYQQRLRDARVKVGNDNPSLDIYSKEFDHLVSAELAK